MTTRPQRDARRPGRRTAAAVSPPIRPVLDPNDPKTLLVERLTPLLTGLPSYFVFNSSISGMNATDLHSLNTMLGASIELQVVRALNLVEQRRVWDPNREWDGWIFERQAQAFPDVRLVPASDRHAPPALGIELKGWFMLAKEGEPSYRYKQCADACADHDLICVVPWYLDNVLSGAPVAGAPWVESAKWSALMRNYWWRHVKGWKGRVADEDKAIYTPDGVKPYPSKQTQTLDVPERDNSNFGRLGRVAGLSKEWVKFTNETALLGIRAQDWQSFFQYYTDTADADDITEALIGHLAFRRTASSEARAAKLISAIREIWAVGEDD